MHVIKYTFTSPRWLAVYCVKCHRRYRQRIRSHHLLLVLLGKKWLVFGLWASPKEHPIYKINEHLHKILWLSCKFSLHLFTPPYESENDNWYRRSSLIIFDRWIMCVWMGIYIFVACLRNVAIYTNHVNWCKKADATSASPHWMAMNEPHNCPTNRSHVFQRRKLWGIIDLQRAQPLEIQNEFMRIIYNWISNHLLVVSFGM